MGITKQEINDRFLRIKKLEEKMLEIQIEIASIEGEMVAIPHWRNLSGFDISEEFEGINYYESWCEIIGYEGLYDVSSFGRFRSHDKYHGNIFKRGIIMKQKVEKRGYLHITLCKDAKTKTFLAHRIIGKHFIPNPLNLPEINHKRGIKADNRIFMLEWSTQPDNVQHAYDTGLMRQDGEHHATRKLNWDKVNEIRRLYMSGVDAADLSKRFGVHFGHIRNICYNIFWKDKNYVWDTRLRKSI
jgi:hypothetical protein